jgi:aspartyl-tRNA(Asn)/glutamyl-tRNA(Gln) amidotransferase subunit C
MGIVRRDVLHAAHLARLELTPEQTERLGQDLERILDYLDQLHQVDVSDVESGMPFTGHRDFFREDLVRPSLSREDALANAPDAAGGMFRVPRVIG